MSKKVVPAKERTIVHALLAAKMANSPYIDIQHPYPADYRGDADKRKVNVFVEEIQAALIEMDDAGLLTIGDSIGVGAFSVTVSPHATTGDQKATPAMLCGEQATSRDRAGSALWLWLLVHGYDGGGYSHHNYGRDGNLAHIFICGLDLSASSAVQDDTWEEFGGTFVDGDRMTGVSGQATCRCGTVRGLSVSAEVESITALLRDILN